MSDSEFGIILVGGLPGSGKTPYLKQLRSEGWQTFDDFQAKAHANSARFRNAKDYTKLIQALRDGQKCVVSDIRIVCADYRSEAERALRNDVGEVSLEWRLFENDPDQCAENILSAQRPPDSRLEKLREFSPKYSFPAGAVRMPVWRR